MQKNIKQLLLILTTVAFGYGLSSCDSDSHSMNDYYGSIATVKVDDGGYAESFILDDGQAMYVASAETAYKPKNERVMISYTVLDEDYSGYDLAIRLNGYFEDILTKPIIYIPADDKKLQDSIGYDKIKIYTLWADGGYLNVGFGYNTTGEGSHLINMVADKEQFVQDDSEPIRLKFRHNANKDPENYGSGKRHVCFKLDEYINANRGNEAIIFEVIWTEYDGTARKETIKYLLPAS